MSSHANVKSGLIQHQPADVHSLAAADEAAELYAAYRGYELDAEQRRTLDGAMSERADGSWAAGEVGDFKGRQAGKNDGIEARECWGLFVGGEKLHIHTAHELPTAIEAFRRMEQLLDSSDELRSKVARIRYGNGDQAVEMLNGGRLLYRARTGGSGRGFAEADLVVYDEAQHLAKEQVAASAATILANPRAQLWVSGSGGLTKSAVAWDMRVRAVLGKSPRLAYTELTPEVPSITDDGGVVFAHEPVADPLDPEFLARYHPGYAAGRVPHDNMVTLHGLLGTELFLREVCCIWDPRPLDDTDGGPLRVWGDLIDAQSTPKPESVKVAIATPVDQTWATFALAGERVDGLHHVEIVTAKPGTRWVVEQATAIVGKLPHVRFVLMRGHPLVGEFDRAGLPVDEMSSAEEVTATGRLIADVQGEAPKIRHRGEPALKRAVDAARPIQVGRDGSTFAAVDKSTDISPLKAVTMAYGRLGTPIDKLPEPFVVFD